MRSLSVIFVLTLLLVSCSQSETKNNDSNSENSQPEQKPLEHQTKDKHSYSNTDEVRVKHIALDLDVNFDEHILSGTAALNLGPHETDQLILDANKLNIQKITIGDGKKTDWKLGKDDKILGQPLFIDIKKDTKKVVVHYTTSPKSKALQWLDPQQTAGKEHPYLFTQGEAILTRSWVPSQDTPENRITYSADISVPDSLMAVMSADNPQEINEDGEYHFEMNNSIPCYLMALAVGNIRFKSISERTGVYAEPSMLDKSASEFRDLDQMLATAEGMYGRYLWERYDVIVLPPSFPFGGMENPRLTFATPTVVAGDRSLVSLLAHELAHSWSGNIVTNATWEDFWLNEGFTVYIENRIMEELYGKSYSNMIITLNYQGLKDEIDTMMNNGKEKDTHLKLDLKDRDPDDGMTAIAYDKGAFFLKTLEEAVGREKFDRFLKGYFQHYKFETLTTKEFVNYLRANLLQPNDVQFNVKEWVYGPGLPPNCARIDSKRFQKVDQQIAKIDSNSDFDVASLNVDEAKWTTHEWLHFINNLPKDLQVKDMKKLDKVFDLTNSPNAEIQAAWYTTSIENGYWGIRPQMDNFLINVGRRKFLAPIYQELSKTEKGTKIAKEIYEKARPNYHSISYNTIDEMLNYQS